MPKANPITRDHVLDAMTYVGTDPAQWPFRSAPKTYVVIDPRNGASLPPKLVLATAAVLDSQSVKSSAHGGAVGFDAAKRDRLRSLMLE